jgi:flagellar biosynthetic protein FliQ
MTPDNVIAIGQQALLVTVYISAPMLISALVVGLLVGMIQAATQVNEMTLSFIPKLLILVAALYLTGPWIMATMIDYTRSLVQEVIPSTLG